MRRQRGSIKLRTRADGSTCYDIWFRDPSGRLKHQLGGATKKEAQTKLNALLPAIANGKYQERRRIKFKDYVTQWLTGRSIKPSTAASYRAILGLPTPSRPHQLLQVFGERYVDTLQTADVNAYLQQTCAGLSVKSRRNIVTLLTTLLADAVAEHYTAINPMTSRALQRPKAMREDEEAEEIEVLTQAELNLLLDALAPEAQPLFLTALHTGMRLGELLGLQWGDLDWRAKQVRVRRSVYRGLFYTPKSRRSKRAIDVGDQLLAVLSRVRRERYGEEAPPADALVFPNEQGKPLDPDNVRNRWWLPALAKAGLRHVRIHSLRHTFASVLIERGENLKYVSAQLGHASIQITADTYGHLLTDRKRPAASAMEQWLAAPAVVTEKVTNGAKPGRTGVNQGEVEAR
jgi:integrase